jgi:hypothetical protein
MNKSLSNIKLLVQRELSMIYYRTSLEGVREEIPDPSLSHLKDSLILCGSFNPMHDGHIKLMH